METTQVPSDWVRSTINHSTQDPNVGFVETLYQTCSLALIHLWKSRFRSIPRGPHKNTLKKDIANIRLWEENYPVGHLDSILEQSNHLKISVIENLKGIGNILMPYLTSCDETATSAQRKSNTTSSLLRELEGHLEKAAIIISAEERSDSSSDDESTDDSSSSTERELNRHGRLHCYINCLMDLTPVIEGHIFCLQQNEEPHPTPYGKTFHLTQGAQPFAMRVRDRFPIAPEPLIERLAEANWERAIRIRALNQEPAEDDSTNNDAVTLFKPYSLFHDSGLGTSIPTRSQYAATVTSHTSYLSVTGDEAHGRPRVPPLPQKHGLRFRCDYCGKTISVRSRVEWKMHVFSDLHSYICTHANCKDALKTFQTRKQWADHEFKEHFTQFQFCCFTCDTTTTTSQSFVDHLRISHGTELVGPRLTAAIQEAKDLVLKFKDHKCALCSLTGWKTRRAYATHVGEHLEEISLACLPRDEGDSSDSDSDSDTSLNMTNMSVHNHDNVAAHEATTSDMDLKFRQVAHRTVHTSGDTPATGKPGVIRGGERIPSGIFMTADYQNSLIKQAPQEAVGMSSKEIHDQSVQHATVQEPDRKPTSYWSVQEQREFPALLVFFGRDFEAIASHMGTKTPTMVKNYFQRGIDAGRTDFEVLTAKAEMPMSESAASTPGSPVTMGTTTAADDELFTRALSGYRDAFLLRYSHLPESERNQLWTQRLSQFMVTAASSSSSSAYWPVGDSDLDRSHD